MNPGTLWNRLREAILAGVLLVSVGGVSASSDEWALHIVFFDVGQADGIAIVSADGDAAVIDAGHGRTAARKIAAFLSDADQNGFADISEAKIGICTHYDQDHMGGFTVLGEEGITFKRVYDQGPSLKRSGDKLYVKYLRAVHDTTDNLEPDEDGFIRQRAKVGLHWKLGDARLKVVTACGDTKGSADDLELDPSLADIDENPGSIAVVLELGAFRLYSGGDQTSDDWKVEPDTEFGVVHSGVLGETNLVDVYKANHHGSDTSNGREFLEQLRPTVCVVSSKMTGHGLPKRIALKSMTDVGSIVYVTGDGTDDFGEFTDSRATEEDDEYVPPEGALRNAAGDVHILVNRDGTRFVVFTETEWTAFSAEVEPDA